MQGNLFRIRRLNTDTSESEPFFVIAPCRESAAIIWFTINSRDQDNSSELVIDMIMHHEDANPA